MDTPGEGAPLYPLYLDLRGKPVLVVGGGPVAERRARGLLASGAVVSVVSPRLADGMRELVATGTVRHVAREFRAKDTAGALLVLAATGDEAVDDAVAIAARDAGALVNVADDLTRSEFHVPAVERRGPIQIAVSTGGSAPGLAVRIRDRIARSLGPEWERLAVLLGETRQLARSRVSDSRRRMDVMAELSSSPELLAAVARDTAPPATELLERALLGQPFVAEAPQSTGALVSIVGAGPGAPGLITCAGLERVREADVIVYDDLVDRRLLEQAPAHAERIYYGKRGWKPGIERPEPALLAEKARETGGRVVRLKGGDPTVFGRVDEELAALAKEGIDFEIIPGITAATAAAAAAQVPLTRRGIASTVTLMAAIGADREPVPHIAETATELLKAGGTVALYMGLRALPGFARDVLAEGADPELPVVMVSRAGSPEQAVLRSTISRAAHDADSAQLASPAIALIGKSLG